MIRFSIAAASLALLVATPSLAGEWDGYNAAMQHQYGTYNDYNSYNPYNRPSYGGYGYQSYAPRRYYGHKYGYRYGYNFRRWRHY